MDNKKIGKLIASLRNKEGMTQQELGDKIGVGFRAVSKWERGLNLPDIGNMTELSKIFGITLDELMAGELKAIEEEPKVKKKISPKIKITISIIISIIILFAAIFIYTTNKTYTYDMVSINRDEYYLEGQVSFKNGKMTLIINSLKFLNNEFNSIVVQNYEYKIYTNNQILFGYGAINAGKNVEQEITIGDIATEFRANYKSDIKLKRTEVVSNEILLIISFLQQDDTIITKEIKISLL